MTLEIRRKVGSKGQVVIPKEVRELFGIRSGTEVAFSVEGKRIVLVPKGTDPLDFVRDFVNIVPESEKVEPPKEIDWDDEYYRQVKERLEGST